jgi:hypothetical protein
VIGAYLLRTRLDDYLRAELIRSPIGSSSTPGTKSRLFSWTREGVDVCEDGMCLVAVFKPAPQCTHDTRLVFGMANNKGGSHA